MKKNKFSCKQILSVILSSLLLSGCVATSTLYQGYTSDNLSKFSLLDEPALIGSWETFDLTLDFKSERRGANLDVSGEVTFGNYYVLNSAQIVTFELFLFVLDNESKVIETSRLVRLSNFSPEYPVLFVKSLQLPSGAESISFGYSGESQGDGGYDRGGGGGGLEAFDDLPKRN